MQNLRNDLKECQPYLIEKYLIPKMYFQEDADNTEYWIFRYTFINRLTTLSIGVRLGYTRQTVLIKLKKILKYNSTIIKEFLNKQFP